MVTVRTLLSVVVARNFKVHQIEYIMLFLHGDLQEEVYMKVPPGFPKEMKERCAGFESPCTN